MLDINGIDRFATTSSGGHRARITRLLRKEGFLAESESRRIMRSDRELT